MNPEAAASQRPTIDQTVSAIWQTIPFVTRYVLSP